MMGIEGKYLFYSEYYDAVLSLKVALDLTIRMREISFSTMGFVSTLPSQKLMQI